MVLPLNLTVYLSRAVCIYNYYFFNSVHFHGGWEISLAIVLFTFQYGHINVYYSNKCNPFLKNSWLQQDTSLLQVCPLWFSWDLHVNRPYLAIAPHSSTLAWKIPWTEEPGGLQSMGSLQVGHDWVTSLSLFTFMHWRRKRQPTPVFLPGESQGQGSLVGCRPWGRTESDTTEAT